MPNINTAIVCGRLTKQPELKQAGNSPVCNFSLATNRRWKDANGEKQEDVEFHNCTLFGKSAEALVQYAVSGQEIAVQGYLKTRTWEKDGVKHYQTGIVCQSFEFGMKPKGESQDVYQHEGDSSLSPKRTAAQAIADGAMSDNIRTEDIPF